MEDFVTYEIARELKENGFKFQCFARYSNGVLYYNTGRFTNCFNELNDDSKIDAPTISQVLKWLREKKKLYVSIMTFMFKEGWCYEVVRLGENPSLVAVHQNSYNTYEKAAIAGIEYVFNNLI